jgi:hypothetical protein
MQLYPAPANKLKIKDFEKLKIPKKHRGQPEQFMNQENTLIKRTKKSNKSKVIKGLSPFFKEPINNSS